MQETLLKIRYFETGVSKNLSGVNLIFTFEPNPFLRTGLQKTKGPGTNYQSILGLQNMFRNTHFKKSPSG